MFEEYWVGPQEDGNLWTGPFASRENAAADGFAEWEDEDVLYTGISVSPKVPLDCWGEDVIERIADRLYDDAGDLAGEWPRNVAKSEWERLDLLIGQALRTWLDETGSWPTWWLIDKIEKHERPGIACEKDR